MKAYKKFSIVLEGGGTVDFDENALKSFDVGDITEEVSKLAEEDKIYKIAGQLFFEIQSSANARKPKSNDRSPFKRITTHNDIVKVTLETEDNEKEIYYPKWSEQGKFNKRQKYLIANNGNLYIAICDEMVGKEKDIKEFFPELMKAAK